MKPFYQDSTLTLYHGDNRDILPLLADNSIDAVVTDPWAGSCTTGLAARAEFVKAILIELEADHCEIGRQRLTIGTPILKGFE